MFAALIDSDRDVLLVLQGLLDQTAQDTVGAHFDEHANAGGVHVLDLLAKANGLYDRAGDGITNGGGIGRMRGCGRVGVDGDPRGAHDDAFEELAERLHRAAHQRRMKRRGHGEPARSDLLLLKPPLGRFDVLGFPGQHALLGGVVVGERELDPP